MKMVVCLTNTFGHKRHWGLWLFSPVNQPLSGYPVHTSLKQITETVWWEGWRPPANIAPCKYDVLELYLSVPVSTLHDRALPNLVAENSQETLLIQNLWNPQLTETMLHNKCLFYFKVLSWKPSDSRQ